MKTISKSQLKAKLLELLRLVEAEGEEIIVTDRGKPVVKIAQYNKKTSTEELFAQMRCPRAHHLGNRHQNQK